MGVKCPSMETGVHQSTDAIMIGWVVGQGKSFIWKKAQILEPYLIQRNGSRRTRPDVDLIPVKLVQCSIQLADSATLLK